MKRKMAPVNALKRKHSENEVKMHFTYLWQCSAHSNSTSKDLVILLLQVHHQNKYLVIHSWHVFGSFPTLSNLLKLTLERNTFFLHLLKLMILNITRYKLQKTKVKETTTCGKRPCASNPSAPCRDNAHHAALTPTS